jgi:hypothetical protein
MVVRAAGDVRAGGPYVSGMDDDDTGFDEAEEVEFDSDWQDINMDGQMELTQDWVDYLAQTDPPANVDGVDTSIADFDEAGAGGEREEANYA